MRLHLSPEAGLSQKRGLTIRHIKPSSFSRGSSFPILFLALAFILSTACTVDERQSGIPQAAQETINLLTEDFAAGRYEKIYREAAEEWRARVTVEQSNEIFRTLKEKLGAIKERTFVSGRRQQTPTAELPANSLVIRYNTKFKREDGTETDGMETFTLIERDGRYWLAGYSVNSNALRQ